MRRTLLLAVLCLVLLAQREALLHPITHVAGHATSSETGLVSQQAGERCLECSLLAGGFGAVHGPVADFATADPPGGIVFLAYHFRAGEVPAWFDSRAPPVLL